MSVFSNFPEQTDKKLRIPQCMDFSPNSGFFAVGDNKGRALLYRWEKLIICTKIVSLRWYMYQIWKAAIRVVNTKSKVRSCKFWTNIFSKDIVGKWLRGFVSRFSSNKRDTLDVHCRAFCNVHKKKYVTHMFDIKVTWNGIKNDVKQSQTMPKGIRGVVIATVL